MSGANDLPDPQPPIPGAAAPRVAEPQIPDVPIPHMGTSSVGTSNGAPPAQANTAQVNMPQPSPPQPAPPPPPAQSPSLPDGVTQEAVDSAIRQVEQTGKTDGIAPQVLAAACAQIEAHAQAHGIDLSAQGAGPSNYVEAAVLDKQSTFDNFNQQRDQLKAAVTEQREAAQKPYQDALTKAQDDGAGLSETDLETVKALAGALRDLDPDTLALINAMGVLTNTPGVLKGVVWMEIIRAMRSLIADEAKHQVEARLPPGTA